MGNTEIGPGQLFREKDSRFVRHVRVVMVDGLFCLVEGVESGRKTWMQVRTLRTRFRPVPEGDAP